ncbi:hypothetical protein K440DRAFT_643352 [Wilcoxina mikolae CBS 423.85]|nr:hypothetical protein K440DRAFT_643352 [Wilcoxina mikolae CBS 423.85]
MWDNPPMRPLDLTRVEDNSDTEIYQSVSGEDDTYSPSSPEAFDADLKFDSQDMDTDQDVISVRSLSIELNFQHLRLYPAHINGRLQSHQRGRSQSGPGGRWTALWIQQKLIRNRNTFGIEWLF